VENDIFSEAYFMRATRRERKCKSEQFGADQSQQEMVFIIFNFVVLLIRGFFSVKNKTKNHYAN
jgi:hypothetical protein